VKRKLPVLLTDVGMGLTEQIGEALGQMIEKPMVKRAMSALGTKSGEVRADKALVDRVADSVLDSSPLVKMAIEKLGISPVEALSLYNDPTVGPIIQGILSSGLDPAKLLGSASSNSSNTASSGEKLFGFNG